MVIASIFLIVYCSRADSLYTLRVVTIDEAVAEWSRAPIVSVDIKENCGPGEESLFSYTWEGTESGCYHYGLYSPDWVDTLAYNNEYNSRHTDSSERRSCISIPSKREVV